MEGGRMSDVALVVEGSYPYVTGGVSAWTQRLIEGLPDVSFSVVNLGEGGTPRYARPANLVEIVDLPVDDETGPVVGELPDALVYHALATGTAGAGAAAAAAERGRPFLLSEHGLAWLEARLGIVGCKGPKGVVDAPRVEAQARRAYRDARAVTAVCAWSAARQRDLGARDARVIHNAAPRIGSDVERDPGAPLIGFVGRVVAVKDVLTFLAACRLVGDELPAARFVVVGPLDHDPDYAARCTAHADALGIEVRFTGATDPAAWYPHLDALVLTSRSEAQPLVALEAMAAGIPVVATAVGGCPELLAGRGLVTRPGDPSATAAAVLRLLRDVALRSRLVTAARRRVEQEHDADAMLAAFASLYEAAA
jgi:polysaccharide biosynthesis protein PelF